MKKLILVLCLGLVLSGCSSSQKTEESSSNSKEEESISTNNNTNVENAEDEKTIDYIEFKDLGTVDVTGLFKETDHHEMEYLSASDGYMYFQDVENQNYTTTAIYQLDVATGNIEEVPYGLPIDSYVVSYVVYNGMEYVTYAYTNEEGTRMEVLTIDGEAMTESDGLIILTDHGESFVVTDWDHDTEHNGSKINWYNNEFDLVGVSYSDTIVDVYNTGSYWGYTDELGIWFYDGKQVAITPLADSGYYNVMTHYIVFDENDNGETCETRLLDLSGDDVFVSANISYGSDPGHKYQCYEVNENEIAVECIQGENIVNVTLDGVQIDGLYDQTGYLSDTEIIFTQYSTVDAFLIGEVIVHEK